MTAERSLIERRQRQYALYEPVSMKYAGKIWKVQRKYFDNLIRQKVLADNFSRTSPISLYGSVISALSGTDLGQFEEFVWKVRRYRDTAIGYIRSRTDNFSAPSYFTVATEKDINAYTEAIASLKEKMARGEDWRSLDRSSLDQWKNKKMEDFRPLDLRDFPRFANQPESIADTVQRVLPDLVLLIFVNVLFFLLAFAAFLRYDAR